MSPPEGAPLMEMVMARVTAQINIAMKAHRPDMWECHDISTQLDVIQVLCAFLEYLEQQPIFG